MRLFLLFLLVAILQGCSTTVPVTAKFPEAPAAIMVKCPQLETINDDAKLSDVAKTVTINYTLYYECAVKHNAFIEWYHKQKHIYESVK